MSPPTIPDNSNSSRGYSMFGQQTIENPYSADKLKLPYPSYDESIYVPRSHTTFPTAYSNNTTNILHNDEHLSITKLTSIIQFCISVYNSPNLVDFTKNTHNIHEMLLNIFEKENIVEGILNQFNEQHNIKIESF